MNLIFNEFIRFLKDRDVNIEKYNLKEGYYWLDNYIIKAYDKEGIIHKIVRIHIDGKLEMTITGYKEEKKVYEIESWYETLTRNIERLELLEKESLDIIQNISNKYKDYNLSILSSTGKDSMLVSHLVNKLYPDTETLFTNTSIDCVDTYKFVKSLKNITIINPKEGFYQWQKRNNFIPTMFHRACCDIFKENAMIRQMPEGEKYLFFMGMRNSESSTRANYTDEWKHTKWGDREWQGVLPIRKWDETDVWLYILLKNIIINPKYKKGYDRVGCAIVCPYQNKLKWVLDKYWYPQMYDRWQNILDEDFTKNNKALVMNCTKEEYKLKSWIGTLLRKTPTEEVINEFAEMNNLNKDIAEKYFCHTCDICNKKIRSKEVLAMNMKYNGRNINKFYCKKDLMKLLNIDKEQWNKNVESFKDQGCDLF